MVTCLGFVSYDSERASVCVYMHYVNSLAGLIPGKEGSDCFLGELLKVSSTL